MPGIAALLVARHRLTATLLPYAAAIYPLHPRSTHAALAAAGARAAGIAGATLTIADPFDHFAESAVLLSRSLRFPPRCCA